MPDQAAPALRLRFLAIAAALAALLTLGLPWIQRRYVDDGPSSQPDPIREISVWDHEQWPGWHLWRSSGLDHWAPAGAWLGLALVLLTIALLVWSVTGDTMVRPGAAAGIELVVVIVLLVLSYILGDVGNGVTEPDPGPDPRVADPLSGVWMFRVALFVHLVAVGWDVVLREPAQTSRPLQE
jgi:hypothetical protein